MKHYYPVQIKNLDGIEIQLIELSIESADGNLPPDFLKTFELNIENDFLAYGEDQSNKPLRAGIAVALNGKAPNWLYAYLTISFKNLCPVYLFNRTIPGYVCGYDSARPPKQQGTVLLTD